MSEMKTMYSVIDSSIMELCATYMDLSGLSVVGEWNVVEMACDSRPSRVTTI